ncbi:MAG: TadE/TadG family type IV pilus assembly protein [Sphingomicrobium sp.]
MFKFLKKLWRDRRGNALVIAGAALPLIIGSAGLATDTIQWALWKRQLQRLADSGAEAGVYAKVLGNTVDNCSTVATATYSAPVAYSVKTNNHLPQTPTCTATNPPTVGGYTADNNAVRVSVSMQRSLSFSSLFLSAAPTITATATATIVPAGKYCAISLINTATTGISAGGNATVNLGCGMITNSTSMNAAIAFGSAAVTASPIAAVGGIPASNNWGSGTVLQPFTIAQPDPYANVNPPAASSYPSGNCPNVTIQPSTTKSTWTAGSDYKAMSDGSLCFGNLTLKGTVTFPSNSVIVLDGGSLNINSGATVNCTGCTFVLSSRTAATNPNSIGSVSMNGAATLNLSAPGTSATAPASNYEGLIFYQDRRAASCTGSNCNLINGNSSSFLQGGVYFPNQSLTFSGTAGMNTNCLQLVALTLTYTGNMSINNSCPADSGASAFAGKLVRLVE